MPQQHRIIVIGAGVIGLNIAWRLAEAGCDVTVVEAATAGSGTSSSSFAWLNASSKVDYSPAYFDLNAQAMRMHATLARRAGNGFWGRPTGDIELAVGAAAIAVLEDKVARLKAMGYAAEMLTAQRLDSLEPGTNLSTDAAAAFYADEGWADVGLFVTALRGFCTASAVTLIERDPAAQVQQSAGRASGVTLASGATLVADAVVTALGRWTTEFAAALGIPVPLVAPEPMGSTALGLLARIVPTHPGPQRMLHSAGVNWSPFAGGRALLASDGGDAVVAQDRSAEAATASAAVLMTEAAALNPLFAGARIEHAGIGIRALPADGRAICGWADELPGLYIAVTHSGVTLSPLLGQLVAREVAGGEIVGMLTAFRPGRFRETR